MVIILYNYRSPRPLSSFIALTQSTPHPAAHKSGGVMAENNERCQTK